MKMPAFAVIALTVVLCQANALDRPPVSEFPFDYRDGLIWVQVQVRKSAVPLNFLLDSGAGLSVINLHTLQRIGSLRGRRITVHGVGTTTTGYWPQHLATDRSGLPLTDCFLAVDLSALGRACNRTVDGLVGEDFFEGHVVQLDFAARKIRLLPSSENLTNRESLPLETRGRALQVPIRVNHNALQWVRLDTGCSSALHWVNGKVNSQECTQSLSVALTTVPVDMAQTSVELGVVRFEDVPTGIHKQPIFEGEAGLLGNGVLSRFSSVIIDAKAGRLLLQSLPTPAGP